MNTNAMPSDTPDVLFYVLNSSDLASRQHFVCKLVQKIWQQNRHCDICCHHPAELTALDEAIWLFKPEAFIPHAIAQNPPAPIQLWFDQVDRPCHDILVNLHPDFQTYFQSYQRTIEVLDQSPELIQRGRDRWRRYQSLGLTQYSIKYREV